MSCRSCPRFRTPTISKLSDGELGRRQHDHGRKQGTGLVPRLKEAAPAGSLNTRLTRLFPNAAGPQRRSIGDRACHAT